MSTSFIRFYNTLSQRVEPFAPSKPNEVGIYVCGVTPYDLAHAGHARTYTTFDVLVRHLRARGFAVTLVRNVTDVDDKILKRASERGEDPIAFSAKMTELCNDDLHAIGCETPTHEPRVSTHIAEVIAVVEKLIERGHAYAVTTEAGVDVYFAVRSFSEYGKLSHRNIDDLLSGARVEVADVKRDPLDFALWKGCGDSGWGWPSPWGKGRPGWHIECSAMAEKYLGPHFDIHCGGMDLIFPHHENEIAQAEGVWGAPFAKLWMHGGFLTLDQEKMSKSLGNFVTIRDVLDRNDAEAFRYFLLGTHYRGPLSFDVDTRADGSVVFPGVDEAERRMDYLYATREGLRAIVDAPGEESGETTSEFAAHAKTIDEAPERVLAALDKDLNAPQALAVVSELLKAANEIATHAKRAVKAPAKLSVLKLLAKRAGDAIDKCVSPLGLMQASGAEFAARTRARRLARRGLESAAVEAKVRDRHAAREAKDFVRADALRKELDALGVELLDSAEGVSWKMTI